MRFGGSRGQTTFVREIDIFFGLGRGCRSVGRVRGGGREGGIHCIQEQTKELAIGSGCKRPLFVWCLGGDQRNESSGKK